MTPQAKAFAKAAHSFDRDPTKKKGKDPNPAAPPIKIVIHNTETQLMFIVGSTKYFWFQIGWSTCTRNKNYNPS